MPLQALVATLAIYGLLAVLLLSLNIFSLWRWWVKALAIVLTGGALVVGALALNQVAGWRSRA